MFDLIIVGGGPAGAAAAVYAARKQLKTLFLTEEWGGQSVVSTDIQNWIGTPHISGSDLAKALQAHVEEYAREWVTIKTGVRAKSVSATDTSIEVRTTKDETYTGSALLVTTGANRRKLAVPGADALEHKGVTYCASCDGPLFSDQDVAVIGGGNAAFETAAQLLAYCKSVTLLVRGDTFRADEITVQKVLAHPNMRSIKNAEFLEVMGDSFVSGLRYTVAGSEAVLAVSGVFVEIGLMPNTEWLGETLALNDSKHVVTDPRTGRTSHPRIWAAGDVTDALYHQNNIAAGDAVRALEHIYATLRAK